MKQPFLDLASSGTCLKLIHGLEFARDAAFAFRAYKSTLRGDALKDVQTLMLYGITRTLIQGFLAQIPPSLREEIPQHLAAYKWKNMPLQKYLIH